MPRTLILHATVGSGHKRAAEALATAFAQRQPGQVAVADILDYMNPVFREAYAGSYVQLVEHVPQLWGYMYTQADRKVPRVLRDLRALVGNISTWGLRELVAKYEPRLIICTHFLPAEVLADRKGRARITAPLYCVITDYAAHQLWAYRNVDGYFVATEQTRHELEERGVNPGLIRVSGIPVDPAIGQPKDPQVVRQRYQIRATSPLIVLFGSSLDVEHVRQIVIGLRESGLQATIMVIAGRNTALQEALADLVSEGDFTVRVLGFIAYVDDLIVAADLIITKAGGLTVSEILARAKPMIIFDPIPGQEESNADYLVGIGAALNIRLPQHVPFAASQLLANAGRLATMSAAAAKVARPRAALEIAETVLHEIGERPV